MQVFQALKSGIFSKISIHFNSLYTVRMSTKNQKQNNSFRLIAGKWRGKRLNLHPNAQLRPTGDRVRETLFNWLSADIVGSRCLDLFAGSGSLGFEALSRGAEFCDFVEKDKLTAQQIRANCELLDLSAKQVGVSIKPALMFLKNTLEKPYDIIFLDPPFRMNLIESLLPSLQKVVAESSLIYIEIEKDAHLPELPENWSVIREKTAGQVRYHLILVE